MIKETLLGATCHTLNTPICCIYSMCTYTLYKTTNCLFHSHLKLGYYLVKYIMYTHKRTNTHTHTH